MENQTLFQALPSSLSGAADVQGSSKAPPSNPHVRTANLLTFCHSLTYAAHKTHTLTHTLCLCVVQMHTRHRHGYVHKIDFEQEAYFRTSFLISPQRSFLSWGYSASLQLTLISFCSAAWKNTACSCTQWKFIYITSPLKDFKTQLPAKWNLGECGWPYLWVFRWQRLLFCN